MNAPAKCLSSVLTIAAVMLVPAGLSAADPSPPGDSPDASVPTCPAGDTQPAPRPRPEEAPQPPAPTATPPVDPSHPPALPVAPPDHAAQPPGADTGSAHDAPCAPADITVPAPSPPSCPHVPDAADAGTPAAQPGSAPSSSPCGPGPCASGAPDHQGGDPDQSGDDPADDGSDAKDAGDDSGNGTPAVPEADVGSPGCEVKVCLAGASVYQPSTPEARIVHPSRRSDSPTATAPSSPQAGHGHLPAYRPAAAVLLPAPSRPATTAKVPAYLLLLLPLAALAPGLGRRLRRSLRR